MKRRLGQQLVIRIVLLSTLLATIATGIQLYFDFRIDAGVIRQNANQIATIHTIPLAEALWTYNSSLAITQLDALLALQGIEYLAIDENGVTRLSMGRGSTDDYETIEVPLNYISDGQVHLLGVLKIGASFDSVYQRLLDKFLLVLATNSLKLLAVAVFIVLLIQGLVTQPIDRLIGHIREIDIDGHLSRQVASNDTDENSTVNEIAEIENAILNLENDLKVSYESLSRSKAELDKRVEERTQDLKEARELAEQLARIDPLTGLNNRRAFFDYSQRIDSQAKRASFRS